MDSSKPPEVDSPIVHASGTPHREYEQSFDGEGGVLDWEELFDSIEAVDFDGNSVENTDPDFFDKPGLDNLDMLEPGIDNEETCEAGIPLDAVHISNSSRHGTSLVTEPDSKAFYTDIDENKATVQKKKAGRRKYEWTHAKLRDLARLYTMTPLDFKAIAFLLSDRDFHPQENTIRKMLSKLLGPKYHFYHLSQNSDRFVHEARLRVMKDDQPALAHFMNSGRLPPSSDLLPTPHESPLSGSINSPFSHKPSPIEVQQSCPWRFEGAERDALPCAETLAEDSSDEIQYNEQRADCHRGGAQSSSPSLSMFEPISHHNRISIQTFSSGLRSLVDSVQRFSLDDSRVSGRTASLPVRAGRHITKLAGLKPGSRRKTEALRSLLAKLYPDTTEQPFSHEEREMLNLLIDNNDTTTPCRRDVLKLRRPCCFPWRISGGLPTAPVVEFRPCKECRLEIVHCFAMKPEYSLETTRSEANQMDIYGNTPLHFVAGRKESILEGVRTLITNGAVLSTRNCASQNFLFALNPDGLGDGLKDLVSLLVLVHQVDPAFDLEHRDYHGQTWLHLLLRHLGGSKISAETVSSVVRAHCPLMVFHLPYLQELHFHIGCPALAQDAQEPRLPKRRYLLGFTDNFGCNILDEMERIGILHDLPERCIILHLHERDRYRSLDWANSFERLRHDFNAKPTEDFEFAYSDYAGLSTVDRSILHHDTRGDTFLISAIKSCAKEAISDLFLDYIIRNFARMAQLEMLDRSGETALFVAAKLGLPHVVHALLKAGANCKLKNYAGVTMMVSIRDQLRYARKVDSKAGILVEMDIMMCMMMILDQELGREPPRHYDRQSNGFNPKPRISRCIVDGVLHIKAFQEEKLEKWLS